LAYVWSLDGKEVVQDQSWEFRAPPPAPPRITDAQPPNEKVVIDAGKTPDFSVAADLPGSASKAQRKVTVEISDKEGAKASPVVWSVTVDSRKEDLRYQWSVNDAPLQTTETGRFRFVDTTPGTYQLTAVAISPDGLKSAPRGWSVEVRPLAVAAVPPSTPTLELSEAEVRDWLDTYRRAWEGRNVDTLVELGEVSRQDADKLREAFSRYKEFRVVLQDVDIRIEGTRATITYTRLDTVDGKPMIHPDRETFTLEKNADGRIAQRK
jgi:hypothetical protein